MPDPERRMVADELRAHEERFANARKPVADARRKLLAEFGDDSNVLGAGFGRRAVEGEPTGEPALVVYVARKVPAEIVPGKRRIPRKLTVSGTEVAVDVVETGPMYFQSYTYRDRPASNGVSCSHVLAGAGTIGCLVRDNTDNTLCILSNNHVIANFGGALQGDAIIQPGTVDGGIPDGDTIARLKRFVSIDGVAPNRVDAAIAEVTGDVEDAMEGERMSPPVTGQQAVGLLYAGSCARTLHNPIHDVMARLDIRMTRPNALSNPVIWGAVQKTGRTSEYNTGRITEIDVTTTVDGTQWEGQIATTPMSSDGDSGSVLCYGGSGAYSPPCSGALIDNCQSVALAEELSGTPLSQDYSRITEARDRYVVETKVGGYAVDVFYKNEDRLQERGRQLQVALEDRLFMQALYVRYAARLKLLLTTFSTSPERITEDHFADAEAALRASRKYLREDEMRAAEQLLELARPALGKGPQQILEMLDDPENYRRVREIMAGVSSLDTSEADFR